MNRRLLISCVLAALCSFAFSQKKFSKITEADFALPAEASDSSVDAVYIYEIGDTRFTENAVSFIMQTYVKVRMQIVTEKGKEYANQTVNYYYDSKSSSGRNDVVSGIDAASYNLVNGKVVKTNMSSKYVFKEQVSDNVMRMKFSIPEVKVGSIIEFKYCITSPRYADVPSWYFQKSEPIRYSYYSAEIPEWFRYHLESRGSAPMTSKEEKTSIQFSTSNGLVPVGATKYVFEAENLRGIKNEKLIYCKNDYSQRVDFELMGIDVPGSVYKNYTSTWADVRKYIADELEVESRMKVKNPYAEEMKALDLAEKPVGVKASRLFALLKSKLKWDKNYAIYCKNPLNAVKEGKGSNIELNYIYMSMLKDAGIPSTMMFVRRRSNGRLPISHASIDNLNTFIVAFTDENGSLLFADCSSDYGDVNVLPDDLMAEGILYDPNITPTPNAGSTRGDIYDLSVIGGNVTNTRITCLVGTDGMIAGQRINTHVGFNALAYKEAYHESEDSLALIEKIEKSLECKLASFKVKNAEGVGRATEERIRFTKEAVVDGDRIFFNPLVFADEKTNYFTNATRVLPVEFPAIQNTTITSVVNIPEGYVVEEMPKEEKIMLPGLLGATISFELQNNSLITKYQSEVGDTFIPVDQYANLQEFWNGLLKMNSMMVTLKKQ